MGTKLGMKMGVMPKAVVGVLVVVMEVLRRVKVTRMAREGKQWECSATAKTCCLWRQRLSRKVRKRKKRRKKTKGKKMKKKAKEKRVRENGQVPLEECGLQGENQDWLISDGQKREENAAELRLKCRQAG